MHNPSRASSALNYLMVSRDWMRRWEFTNSGWMRKLEAVERLIVIPDDAEVCDIAYKIDHPLFGPVEVLIFVHEHVIVQVTFRCDRIVLEITINVRNNLADQHSFMEGEPTHKHTLKGSVSCIVSVSWHFVLQPRPCSFVGAYALAPRALISEIVDRSESSGSSSNLFSGRAVCPAV